MATVAEVRRLVPAGFDLVAGEDSQSGDVVVLVLHGSLCVTVINANKDVAQQVAEDTCEAHRAFVCPRCFPRAYEES